MARLVKKAEGAGVKFHHLGEVGQEISEAVVAGVRMVLVLHALLLQFVVQGGSAFFETVVVILAAVEIDCELFEGGCILAGQKKWIVRVPVRNVDRISEDMPPALFPGGAPERAARSSSRGDSVISAAL